MKMKGKMKVSQVPIYYRDLNEQMKSEYLEVWKNNKQKELLKAVEQDDDVVVGVFCQGSEAFVEDYKDKRVVVE